MNESENNGTKLDTMAVDFNAFDQRLLKLEQSVALNNEMTSTLLELFSVAKSGLKFMGWFGSVVKWAGMVGGGVAGMYAAYRAAKGG